MVDLVLAVAVGVVVGWQLPQPLWAKAATEWVKAKFAK